MTLRDDGIEERRNRRKLLGGIIAAMFLILVCLVVLYLKFGPDIASTFLAMALGRGGTPTPTPPPTATVTTTTPTPTPTSEIEVHVLSDTTISVKTPVSYPSGLPWMGVMTLLLERGEDATVSVRCSNALYETGKPPETIQLHGADEVQIPFVLIGEDAECQLVVDGIPCSSWTIAASDAEKETYIVCSLPGGERGAEEDGGQGNIDAGTEETAWVAEPFTLTPTAVVTVSEEMGWLGVGDTVTDAVSSVYVPDFTYDQVRSGVTQEGKYVVSRVLFIFTVDHPDDVVAVGVELPTVLPGTGGRVEVGVWYGDVPPDVDDWNNTAVYTPIAAIPTSPQITDTRMVTATIPWDHPTSRVVLMMRSAEEGVGDELRSATLSGIGPQGRTPMHLLVVRAQGGEE